MCNRPTLSPLLSLPRLFLEGLRDIPSNAFYWWFRGMVGGREVDVYGRIYGVGECDDCEPCFLFPLCSICDWSCVGVGGGGERSEGFVTMC